MGACQQALMACDPRVGSPGYGKGDPRRTTSRVHARAGMNGDADSRECLISCTGVQRCTEPLVTRAYTPTVWAWA
eukprot:362607-Chlamydomonas_euryale.AAC.4